MKKRIISLFFVLALFCAMLPATSQAVNSGTTAWVATSNRGALNVRSSCSTSENNIIDSLSWGTQVTFLSYSSGNAWMYVQFTKSNYVGFGYVMSKYISFTNPGVKPTVQPTTQPSPAAPQLDFSQFRSVTPYGVYANPSRPTGWVNLRWAPSTDVDVIERCYQYRQLIVIAQNNTWAQVYDPDSGVVGFISRAYIKDLGYGVTLNIAQQ